MGTTGRNYEGGRGIAERIAERDSLREIRYVRELTGEGEYRAMRALDLSESNGDEKSGQVRIGCIEADRF